MGSSSIDELRDLLLPGLREEDIFFLQVEISFINVHFFYKRDTYALLEFSFVCCSSIAFS